MWGGWHKAKHIWAERASRAVKLVLLCAPRACRRALSSGLSSPYPGMTDRGVVASLSEAAAVTADC